MAPNDPKTEVVPPAEVPEDLPLPADPKSYSLVVYSSLRRWRQPMSQAKSYCHWSLLSFSSSCCSQPCAYWSGCTYREYSRRCF